MALNASRPWARQNQLMAMQIGETFFQRWQSADKIQKIKLLGQTVLYPHGLSVFESSSTLNELTDEQRTSYRYQIGARILKAQSSLINRLTLPFHFSALALHYRRQQTRLAPYMDWDIGLQNDPLVQWPLPPDSDALLTQRRKDLIAITDRMEKFAPPGLSPPFAQPLLYVSGMAKSRTPSGYGIRTHHILDSLRRNGVEVQVAYLGLNLDFQNNERLLKDAETIYAALGKNADIIHLVKTAIEALASRARAAGARSIASGSNWLSGYCAFQAARQLGLPFLYDVRGLWYLTRSAVDPAFAATSAYEIQHRAEFALMRAADQVFVISEGLKSLAIENGVSPKRIRVVPNGIDITGNSMPESHNSLRDFLGLDPETDVIGYAGSVTQYEQLDILIDALALSYNSNTGKSWHLIIAGQGSALAALKTQAAQKQMLEHVSFMGHVSREHVNTLISAASLMAYPRSGHKTFQYVPPLKPLEPMLKGTPCLFSDIRPHRELAGPKQSRGFIVSSATPEAWQDAIELLLSEPERCNSITSEAAKWVRLHRSIDVVFAPWTERFKSSR